MNTVSIIFVLVAALAVVEVHSVEADATKAGQMKKMLNDVQKLESAIAEIKAAATKKDVEVKPVVKDAPKVEAPKVEKKVETMKDPLTPEEKKAVAALTPEEKAIAKEAVREVKAGNKALVAAGVSAAKIKQVEKQVQAVAKARFEALPADKKAAAEKKFFKELGEFEKLSPEARIAAVKAMQDKYKKQGADQVKQKVKSFIHKALDMVREKRAEQNDPLTPEEKKAVAALTPEEKAIAKEAVRELKAGNKALVAAGVSAAKIKEVEEKVEGIAEARFKALPADKKAAAEKQFFKQLGEFEKLSPKAKIAAVTAMQDKAKKQSADQVKDEVKSFIHKAFDTVMEKRAEREMADKEEQRRDMIKGAITRVYDAVRERIAQRQQKPKRDARTEKIHRIIDAVKQWIS